MERRKAVIAAGAVSLTLLAGAAAISLNTGLVSAEENDDDGVGDLTVTTVPAATTADPGAPVQVPGDDAYDDDGYDDFDDEYEDGEHESEDEEHESEDGEHESEGAEHEYEGAEDDD